MQDDNILFYAYVTFLIVACLALGTAVYGGLVWLTYNHALFYAPKSLRYLWQVTFNWHYHSWLFWEVWGSFWASVLLCIYLQTKNPFNLSKQYSRFARWSDIKKMIPALLKPDGFALGIFGGIFGFGGTVLKTNEPLATFCVAPAGAGKTSGTVVPTILSCDKDCLVVNDPKGELYNFTHKYRGSVGKVFRIEWGQNKSAQDDKTTFWNPIARANMPSDTAGRARYVEMVTNILIKQAKGDTFWSNSARKTLSAMILFSTYKAELTECDSSIGEVKDFLATIAIKPEGEAEDEFSAAPPKDPAQEGFKRKADEVMGLAIPEVIKQRCFVVFQELAATSPNTLGGILASVSSDLSVFNNENVRDVTSKNTFLMKDIRGIDNKPVTVYLVSPASDQELFGVLSGIFVEVCYKYITSQSLDVVKKSNIVRFILDEVAFFPVISAVIDGPAIARGYKGSFLFVCQDLGQIREKYGDNGVNTMMTNTAFKIILPQNNDDTARRLAGLGGQTEIYEWVGADKNRHRVKKLIPLMTATDVMSLPAGKQIVIVQNNAKTPILCKIPFFFKNKEMMRKIKGAT